MERFADVVVKQLRVPERDRANEHVDSIQIRIRFCIAFFDRYSPDGPRESRYSDLLHTTYCRVLLGSIKKKRSSYRRYCRSFFASRIADQDTLINIPRKAHSVALSKLFQAFDAAIVPELPIELEIWELIVYTWEQPYESFINFVPATRDSIEGLERLRLQVVGGDQCAICLEDYDQPAVVVTRLPCSHYFHTDCTALWLHTNHICPLCRFALPTTPPQQP